ncbi:MAG TPA: LytTR family DNA-binding domain-containing protein [Rhodanobacteraceae bacterium]|nr:LytTR family DNA-binding domain-containing protein [Rhodanobacteraceae bacterium]
MTVRTLIVDDEPLARRGISRRLAAHSDFTIIGEADDGEVALAKMQADHPDLVFMDVKMPGASGLETLQDLPRGKRPLIVFLTAYDHFALEAFEVRALDYLLKPIDDDRFTEALARVREAVEARRLQPSCGHEDALHDRDSGTTGVSRLAVRTGHRIVLVDVRQIDWIEAMGDYAGLHVAGKVHLLREPLHRLVQRLDPKQFVRIHRSTIVRLACIADMRALSNRDTLLRLHDGTRLRVSRTYIDALRGALALHTSTSG